MSSEGHGVAFDVGATTTLPSMGHADWLGFTGDFSSFGAPFPGAYSFESKAFSAFPPLQSQQAVPVNVNVNRAEVDSTGDSKGPPTPASAVSGTSQGDERADSSPTSASNAGYRPWEQVAESYTEEKSPPTKTAANATSSTEAFHNVSTLAAARRVGTEKCLRPSRSDRVAVDVGRQAGRHKDVPLSLNGD